MIRLYSDPQRVVDIKKRTCTDLVTMAQFLRCLAIDPDLGATEVFERVIAIWSTVGLLATLSLAFSTISLFVSHIITFSNPNNKEAFGILGGVAIFLGLTSAVSATTCILMFTVSQQGWKRQLLLNIAWLVLLPLYICVLSLLSFTAMTLIYISEVFPNNVLYIAVALESNFIGVFVAIFISTAIFWKKITGIEQQAGTHDGPNSSDYSLSSNQQLLPL